MRLRELLRGIRFRMIQGDEDTEIASVANDTRKALPGSLFLCIKGVKADGHELFGEAVERGAVALLTERPVEAPEDVAVIRVKDSRYAMAFIAANYYQNPADQMKIIGITGTKGKTTTAYLIKSMLEGAGHKVGLVGTIETVIGKRRIPAENTTPESLLLQQYFREMKDEGCDMAVMEVSSQALKLHRTQGFLFDAGIFTNIEPDHIGPGEHESFEEYMECKGRLFRQCRLGIVNADDPRLQEVLKGHTCELCTFGFQEGADYRAGNVKLVTGPGYLGVSFHVSGRLNIDAEADTPGRFSVYNALAAIAVCAEYGVGTGSLQRTLKEARVKGRIEMVRVSDEFTLMIDYAHNAMALTSLLKTLREYRPGRLVCLFGCGGNRAKNRRFEMGEVSGKLADLTIITSDNPRFEEPQDIIEDIKTGIAKTGGKYVEICDRKEAIAYAIQNGRPGDVIVLAGKGHEDYQEIRGVKYPMDERTLIREILEENRNSSGGR